MSPPTTRKLRITRTPETEGVIYEVASTASDYSLTVELVTNYEALFAGLRCVSGYFLKFRALSDALNALVHYQALRVEFLSADGSPKGGVREASFSVIGKAIVEDESGRHLGSIRGGIRNDHVLSASGREIGTVTRVSTKDLPAILSPSNSHLAERYEFVHELGDDFDDRLLYAFICRLVLMERLSS